ncbi:MAG: ATP-dependent RNA helicase HrpA [Burkholderiales bacterium]|nr:ATP-dependent RNA helicase HrpA [Burkholderiales bacterium]
MTTNVIQQINETDLTYKQYWLNQLNKLDKNSSRYTRLIEGIQKAITHAESRNLLIQNTKITYPPELPVSQEVNSIKKLIKENQVIIICGETGSGKTTQLPKVLLEMGYAARGLIGHTQPRRIAAKSLSNRISQELNCTDNENNLVACKMRFTDSTKPNTAIKLMTDGILLQEIQNDKLLLQYSAIIIDEVHERSLNIDFILGYLQQLVKRRPDLKIIITSATLENEKLAKFFATNAILNVSGKTYPVDIVYQAYQDEDDDDMSLNKAIYQAIVAALEVDCGNGLVFLPGEREIKHCLQYLRKTELKSYEILPLYARQNNEEQTQIFNNDGKLKIILATNIAETSLTIPGIKFVIDTGLARVKRYSVRNRVEQLQIENISQASSKQRAGRAGRTSQGLCVRLFSEIEFNQRKSYTEPELLRSNLANVILRLLSLNIGEVSTFPFLDAPENKSFNDGFRTLYQVGAIDESNKITSTGHKLAKIPVDVQLAKILLASAEKFASLKEALVVVSFLAIQDPREFPIEHQQLVRERHSIWADKKSEFIQILNLWRWYQEELQHKKSNKKLIETCHKHFLSVVRLREWRELYRQLKETMIGLGYKENSTEGNYESIHRSILSGFIVNIGQKDIVEKHYLSTNSRKFYLHPSAQIDAAKWVVSSNLVETTRLYARNSASIEPEWLNGIANHLYRYTYTNCHWDKKRGEVLAYKTSLLYGLSIYSEKISYAQVDNKLTREIMIREGIVANQLVKNYPFMVHNQRVIHEVENLEDKLRTSLAMIEDELYQFYLDVLPLDILDVPSLEQFLKVNQDKLKINQEEFINRLVVNNEYAALYPDFIENNGVKIKLKYVFDHDSEEDGLVALINLTELPLLNKKQFDWLVVGLIRDKITYLIKSLPKATRLQFNPLQDTINEFLSIANLENSIIEEFVTYAVKYKKISLNYTTLIDTKFTTQYICHFRILDNKRVIATGNNLEKLQDELSGKLNKIVVQHTAAEQINNIATYITEFNNLLQETQIANGKVRAYNSLIIEKDKSITYGVVPELMKAEQSTRRAIIYLVKLSLKEQQKYLSTKKINGFPEVSFALIDIYKKDDLIAACTNYILNNAVIMNLSNKYNLSEDEFNHLLAKSKVSVSELLPLFSNTMQQIAKLYKELKIQAENHDLEESIYEQLDDLIYESFLDYTHWQFLQEYPRYLRAMIIRLDKYQKSSSKDSSSQAEIDIIYNKWLDIIEELENKKKSVSRVLHDFRYKIEELKISLFAQEIKTLYPVSSKRLQNELEVIYLANLK